MTSDRGDEVLLMISFCFDTKQVHFYATAANIIELKWLEIGELP